MPGHIDILLSLFHSHAAYLITPFYVRPSPVTWVWAFPPAVTITMILTRPAISGHIKTSVKQTVLYESVDNCIKLTADKSQDSYTSTGNGCFERVGYGAAYQHVNAHAGHLPCP